MYQSFFFKDALADLIVYKSRKFTLVVYIQLSKVPLYFVLALIFTL